MECSITSLLSCEFFLVNFQIFYSLLISYWLVCWLLILPQTFFLLLLLCELLKSRFCIFNINAKAKNEQEEEEMMRDENKVKWVAEGQKIGKTKSFFECSS
jgi:hypothetical protein